MKPVILEAKKNVELDREHCRKCLHMFKWEKTTLKMTPIEDETEKMRKRDVSIIISRSNWKIEIVPQEDIEKCFKLFKEKLKFYRNSICH